MKTPSASLGPRSVLVAGVGNPDRGDDGFGPAVASRIAALSLSFVESIVCRRPLDLLDRWTGRELAIVVDAALGEEPGGLRRLEPPAGELFRSTSPSTHGLGVAEAIDLGRSLGLLPARLVLYVARARSFVHGAPLSPAVDAAVGEAVRRIAGECLRYSETAVARTGPGADGCPAGPTPSGTVVPEESRNGGLRPRKPGR